MDEMEAPDRLGVIPGSEETSAEVETRLAKLRAFEAALGAAFARGEPFVAEDLSFPADSRIPPAVIAACLAPASRRYDFTLPWVPGFYSDQGLGYCLGGMAIGLEESDRGHPVCLFQLRRAFQHSGRFWIYSREELISHEGCHVARMALGAEKYEELLAYRLSESRFRRLVGPIFTSPRQVPLFIAMVLLFLTGQLLNIFLIPDSPLLWLFRLPLPLLLLVWWIGNQRRHRTFERALANLRQIAPAQSEAVIFRLADAEIDALGAEPLTPSAVREWLAKRLSETRLAMLKRYLSA